MRAIADTSTLIFLARLGRLGILKRFRPLTTTEAVVREVQAGSVRHDQTVRLITEYLATAKVRIRKVNPPSDWLPNLGAGEQSILFVGRKERTSLLLVDEERARQIARAMGLQVRSALVLLVEECRACRLSRTEFETALDGLLAANYYVHPRVVEAARRLLPPS